MEMEIPEGRYIEAIGRRKRATARVRIYPSSANGKIIVNGKEATDFFTRYGDMKTLLSPLGDAELEGKMDVTVLVKGGGVTGQTDAVRLGLARAIVKYDEEMRGLLRGGGHLTRDPRVKERKKPGLKRARKAPTYTKR